MYKNNKTKKILETIDYIDIFLSIGQNTDKKKSTVCDPLLENLIIFIYCVPIIKRYVFKTVIELIEIKLLKESIFLIYT